MNSADKAGDANEFAHLGLRSKSIVAKEDGVRRIFRKDSIFGYRLHNQKCYRWDRVNARAFEILENATVVIYMAYEPEYGSKGPMQQPKMFFSRDLDAPIAPLTVQNVKRAFPSEFELHHFLDLLERPETIADRNPETGAFNIQLILKTMVHSDPNF